MQLASMIKTILCTSDVVQILMSYRPLSSIIATHLGGGSKSVQARTWLWRASGRWVSGTLTVVWLVRSGTECPPPHPHPSMRAACGPAGLLWVERRDRRPRELHWENVSIPSHPCQATRGWPGPLAPLPAGWMELWSWELAELCNVTVGGDEKEGVIFLFLPHYQGDVIIIASDLQY